MYSNNEQLYWQDLYGNGVYGHSAPYQTIHLPFDERQFLPGFPSTPPPAAPPSQGMQVGPPTSPPPSYVPAQTQQAEAFAVDPGSIRRCLFRFTYVWLRGFQQFWFYPTYVGRRSVSGYRWNGFSWVYFGVSLRQIQSFTCI